MNNKTLVSIKKPLTYGTNDAKCELFRLFLVVITIGQPPCCVLGRIHNKISVSINKKHKEKEKKKNTNGPNEVCLSSFGLFLIIVTIQLPVMDYVDNNLYIK